MKDTTNKLNLNKKIAVVGTLGALTVLLGITPIGFIRLPWGLAITLLHIPTILGTFVAGGIAGTGIGAIFGIFSMIQAASNPVGLDALFVNPLISVLPRLLLAPTAALIYYALCKIKPLPKAVSATVAAALATIVHTIYVSFALYLFAGTQVTNLMSGAGLGAFILLLLPNAVAEAIAAGVICGGVIGVISVTSEKKSKLAQEIEKTSLE
ncbi:MAG: ECF transporter S component [Spirochaetaceae bacterium]|nr:ECF transporter S component [Spirochaetaceae bacterium]